MEGIKEKNRELLVTLDAIQRERQRLLALRVAIDDAIQGIDAIALTFTQYTRSMTTKIQEAKQVGKIKTSTDPKKRGGKRS